LAKAGWNVEAVGIDTDDFRADLPFRTFDLNEREWPFEPESYALVTAIEIIEHMESPVGFLRNMSRLLSADGVGFLSTPNVDSLAARLKFLARGRLRQLDAHGDPTHISPIFEDLFTRMYLPAAGLNLQGRWVYPENGHLASRPSVRAVFKLIGRLLPMPLTGDTNVFAMRRAR
jgi:hypothetical protein